MKFTLVSFCTETKPHLLELTSNTSRYQLPIASRYRIIDWVISNAFNIGAEKVILFEKFHMDKLHEFIENYFLSTRAPETKILRRDDKNIFEDFHRVIKNEDAEIYAIYNGDNPALADFRAAKKEFINSGENAMVFRAYYDMKPGEQFKILFAKKKTLLKILDKLIKSGENVPVPFETLCNNVINANMAERKISGYYKLLENIYDYYSCNMDFLKNQKFFNNLFDRNPLGSFLISEGNAKVNRGAHVKNSFIAENVEVNGYIENTILFPNVVISRGAILKDCIVLSNNIIGKKANLIRTIIDETGEQKTSPHPNIGVGTEIGRNTQNTINSIFKKDLFGGITYIGKDCYIPRNVKIGSGCYIKSNTDGNVLGKTDRIFDGQTV